MKEFNAVVKVVDEEALAKCANEYYEGDIDAAVKGELAWVEQSGLEVEIIGSEKTGYKDLELTPEMEKRNDEIESAVYDCLCILVVSAGVRGYLLMRFRRKVINTSVMVPSAALASLRHKL